MRVGVSRLDSALRRVEVDASFEPVVLVVGALRKERPECPDVVGDTVCREAGCKAPVEKSGGRVRRPVETVGEGRECAMLSGKAESQLDHVESRLGG